jgi:hypothetical protein
MPELAVGSDAQLRDALPEVRVVMLSMHANEAYAAGATGRGRGLTKDSAAAELERAESRCKETYLSPPISNRS